MKYEKYTDPVSIGFDIGVKSLGTGVININNGQVIEAISNIFNERKADNNVTRRNARHARRTNHRRKNRLNDFINFVQKTGFYSDNDLKDRELFKQYQNPYQLRVKGLTEKLSKPEFLAAIFNLIKHRGISYSLEDAEELGEGNDYRSSLQINQNLLKTKTPGEIQNERFLKYGKVRGLVKGEDNQLLRNVFPTSAFKDELLKILKTQQQFYPEIDQDFVKGTIDILVRKREYFEGPGSEKSRTDYGIYRENGETLDNLFEILIGKDSVNQNKTRAAGNSYTAQYFNLINDLNNLRVASNEEQKLTVTQKDKIVEEILTTDKNIQMMKLILKVTGADREDISGYRVDSNGKPIFNSMPVYRKVRKKFLNLGFDVDQWKVQTYTNSDGEQICFWDDLGKVITLNTENNEIRRQLSKGNFKKYEFLDDDLINAILENKDDFKLPSNNKWHRLSLFTMQKLIPEMKKTGKEQSSLIHEMGLIDNEKFAYSGKKHLNANHIVDQIYNPVVSKSVNQAIKTFNALLDKYSNIKYVVIELPRDRNSDEEKDKIKNFQKNNKNEKDKSLTTFAQAINMSEEAVINQYHKYRNLSFKVRLWYQQDGKCPYSGKVIDPNDLFSNPDSFEIDHIIPFSVSLDDSVNNKVLCYAEMNADKSKATPYQFFLSGKGQGYKQMVAMINGLTNMSNIKKRNLESKIDINNIETRQRFIARNLVDTRWASRVILKEINEFIKANELPIKVMVVRGSFTAHLRNKWNISKSRDTYHHHAKDAAIIAAVPLLKNWKNNNQFIPKSVSDQKVDIDTGEIIDDRQFNDALYSEVFPGFNDQIRNLDNQIKFKHEVDRKMNRRTNDDTIYSIRKTKIGKDKQETEYVIGVIKDIYDYDGYKKLKGLIEKNPEKILMNKIDPKTFHILEEIITKYPDTEENENGKTTKVSPFELYRRENGKVRKYSKRGNGPEITSIKFYNKKFNEGIIIRETPTKKVALMSLKLWRTDVYYNSETLNYEIMGIKYSDLNFVGGDYGIQSTRYKEIKEKEGIGSNSKFMFSLYSGDRLKVQTPDESGEFIYSSKPKPKNNSIIVKPIFREQFLPSMTTVPVYGTSSSNGTVERAITKPGWKLYKVNTDILGNPFYISREGNYPKNIID